MPILPPTRTSAGAFAPHLLAAGTDARRQRMGLQLGNIQTLRDKRNRILAVLGRIRQERAAKKAQEAAEPAFGGFGGPAGGVGGAVIGGLIAGPAGALVGAGVGAGVGGGVEESLSGDPQALGRSLNEAIPNVWRDGSGQQTLELFTPRPQALDAFDRLGP